MDKEKMEIALKELMDLYEQGKYEEINRIEFDNNETYERQLAAHVIAQLGPDPRRLI